MALIRHRLPLLLAPVLAAPGMLPAPACHHQRRESSHATSCVPGHREQNIRGAGLSAQDNLSLQRQLAKATPMSQRTEQRRQQAIDKYLADDKIEDICRQLVCSKSWLYKWRDRYDAHNPAWGQERSTRPKHSPPQTPAHVARAIVSLHVTLRQNGTGGGATAIMQGLAQQGIEPIPSRRTIYRIVRHHSKEVK
jgi:transposase-like protein